MGVRAAQPLVVPGAMRRVEMAAHQPGMGAVAGPWSPPATFARERGWEVRVPARRVSGYPLDEVTMVEVCIQAPTGASRKAP